MSKKHESARRAAAAHPPAMMAKTITLQLSDDDLSVADSDQPLDELEYLHTRIVAMSHAKQQQFLARFSEDELGCLRDAASELLADLPDAHLVTKRVRLARLRREVEELERQLKADN
jgi:hypothetical protein